MTTVQYSENNHLISRFVSHVQLGLQQDIGDHNKHLIEKIGDVGLWIIEELPRKLWRAMKEPRVVTVALTALALLADSFAFYPLNTWNALKWAVNVIPWPPFWAVRLTCYIVTVGLILAAACRAYGRFSNAELMQQFYRAS